MPPSLRRLGWLAAICFLVSGALQLPLAWAWVMLWRPGGQEEDSFLIRAPAGSSSGIAAIKVENDGYAGARWAQVTGWSAGALGPIQLFRSNPSEPFDSNPTYPWAPGEVLPALTDPAQWPQRPAPPAYPGAVYGVTFCQLEAIGWPFLCARGRADLDAAQSSWSYSGVIYVRSPLLGDFPRSRTAALCYRPLWPGYVLNTIIYGGAMFAAVVSLGAWRRTHRRRRAQCQRCGYDLSGLGAGSACPECGHPSVAR